MVPAPVTDVADRIHVILSDVLKDHVTPVAVPFWVMSDVVKLDPLTALEKTTVNTADKVFVGSG